MLRPRLRRLADQLAEAIGPFGHRVFTDSAPVLEVELAARSGIGWRGKHTLALDRDAGSMFFLGEIFVDVALPETPVVSDHCGSCSACIDVCPTQAIVAPYELDARRCISYLTIEPRARSRSSSAPRSAIASTVATIASSSARGTSSRSASPIADFDVRPALDAPRLLDLWAWREDDFLRETEGSAIRRIGFERWQRNLAVALGNALAASGDPAIVAALKARREEASASFASTSTGRCEQAAPAALAALPA